LSEKRGHLLMAGNVNIQKIPFFFYDYFDTFAEIDRYGNIF
jgi:hypothetical protein